MIKRFLIAFILLVLVVGGLVGFNVFRDRAIQQYFANMPVQPLTVSATEAKAITWRPEIAAIGTAAASRGVDLTVETTGIVRDINFEANEHVEQGQVLVQLDDAVQRADLAAARAQAALDQQALDRALELQKRGVGSTASLDQAQATASASKSQVVKLEAVLDQKQIKAPFSGTIGIRRIDVGQYLSPGSTVATLQDLDTMHADFTVPEQQLGLLKIGQPVRLGLNDDALDLKGSIIGIDPKVDPATRLVAVRARITNPGNRLSPGQFVQVRVELAAEGGVLALPQTAVVSSLYGDYVYAVRKADAADGKGAGEAASGGGAQGGDSEGKPEGGQADNGEPQLVARQVFVQTGRRDHGMIEILKGIGEGEQVVTAGQNRLSGGSPVTIDNTIDPAEVAEGAAGRQGAAEEQ